MALFSLAKATEEIILVDSYADILALDYFKEKRNDVSVRFVISSKSRLTQVEVDAFNLSFGNRTVRVGDGFHDRFLIINGILLYHLGASLNYMGQKTFAIGKIEDPDYLALSLFK